MRCLTKTCQRSNSDDKTKSRQVKNKDDEQTTIDVISPHQAPGGQIGDVWIGLFAEIRA